jgi:hypothetical protein
MGIVGTQPRAGDLGSIDTQSQSSLTEAGPLLENQIECQCDRASFQRGVD